MAKKKLSLQNGSKKIVKLMTLTAISAITPAVNANLTANTLYQHLLTTKSISQDLPSDINDCGGWTVK